MRARAPRCQLARFALVAAVGAPGCRARPSTELVVRVQTDIPQGAPGGLGAVRVRIFRGATNETLFDRAAPLAPGDGGVVLPADLVSVSPRDGDPMREIVVQVDGLTDPAATATPRVTTRARTAFRFEQRAWLVLTLDATCAGVACPATDQTCAAGRCVSDVAARLCDGDADASVAAGCVSIESGCGDPDAGGGCEVGVPRAIAPLSGLLVPSPHVPLRWTLPPRATGARVELCGERACTHVLSSRDVAGTSATVDAPIRAGAPSQVFYWRLRGLENARASTATSPVWMFTATRADQPARAARQPAVDVNGDGYADLVVASPTALAFEVHLGRAEGLAATPSQIVRARAGVSTFPGLLAAADVDGDGFTDVLATLPNLAGDAGVELYRGGPSGVSATPAVSFRAAVSPSTYPLAAPLNAGDVDGDGFTDVLVTFVHAGPGAVELHRGGPGGLATAPSQTLSSTGRPTSLQRMITAGRDVNGDGYADALFEEFDQTDAYSYFGGAMLYGARASATWGLATGASALADTNGDGLVDVVLAGHNVGAPISVFFGAPAPAVPPIGADATVSPVTDVVEFMLGAGDYDADGRDDLVVGVPDRGEVRIVWGGDAGPRRDNPWVFSSSGNVGWNFGQYVAAGDYNGNGAPEFAFGVYPPNDAATGRVYVFEGRDGQAPSTTPTLVIQSTTDPVFGAALAY